MSKKDNCEACEDCLYIGEGDYICIKYMPPMVVKNEWIPTNYYCNCKACEECAFEHEG